MKIKHENDVYFLSGDMDENSQFGDLAFAKSPVRIDWKGIERINSLGIRAFINFLVTCKGKVIQYENCPPEFIDQVNMIGALTFQEGLEIAIVSAFVPFMCESCDHIEDVLLAHDEMKVIAAGTKQKTCSSCGDDSVVEFQEFFSFLS